MLAPAAKLPVALLASLLAIVQSGFAGQCWAEPMALTLAVAAMGWAAAAASEWDAKAAEQQCQQATSTVALSYVPLLKCRDHTQETKMLSVESGDRMQVMPAVRAT